MIFIEGLANIIDILVNFQLCHGFVSLMTLVWTKLSIMFMIIILLLNFS